MKNDDEDMDDTPNFWYFFLCSKLCFELLQNIIRHVSSNNILNFETFTLYCSSLYVTYMRHRNMALVFVKY
jgi:hypothetical protein